MDTKFEKLKMDNVKHIIAVASGKGGVGKSTVASNLAVAFARNGYKTALVDADIFGPSIPRMFGIENAQPEISAFGDKQIFFPVKKFGVEVISIGFFIDKHQPVIWRGPLAGKALTQLFGDTQWSDIDYMFIDFPPGTSDIQLTSVQNLNITGALMVTTPQEISVNDARKAASMFTNHDINIPILGIIENMSWFTPEKHPDEKYYVFGKGGGHAMAREFNTRLLGQIPLVMEAGEAAEKGLNVFNTGSKEIITAFETITEQLLSALNETIEKNEGIKA